MERLTETTAGKVAGRRVGDVDVFLGIPYAAPPVGALRLRPPAPVQPWPDVRDCTAYGPMPPQPTVAAIPIQLPEQDEDCLSVNVWTPSCDDGAGRPVMVWLYGGGFVGGGAAMPWTDGARLAGAGDVVVVTLNYRVGPLGFVHLAHLLGDDYADAGNLGLLDAVAALRWVRENAASFGGDPGNVTVFGESAGGVMAALLLVNEEARGLFHRVVVQSAGVQTVHTVEQACRTTGRLLAELDVGEGGARRILDAPVADLMAAQLRVLRASMEEERSSPLAPRYSVPFQPVTDGRALPLSVPQGLAAADPSITVMVGWNAHEANLSGPHLHGTDVTDEQLEGRAAEMLGGAEGGRAAVAVYRAGRPGASARELLFAMEADRRVRVPAQQILEAFPGGGYAYCFDLDGTGMATETGAAHTFEIPFVFETLDSPLARMFLGEPTAEGWALAGRMRAAWAAFAATGAPAVPGLPEWPAYDRERRTVVELSARPVVREAPFDAERAVWDDVGAC
jgi:para-nitrobenzyl esterase